MKFVLKLKRAKYKNHFDKMIMKEELSKFDKQSRKEKSNIEKAKAKTNNVIKRVRISEAIDILEKNLSEEEYKRVGSILDDIESNISKQYYYINYEFAGKTIPE